VTHRRVSEAPCGTYAGYQRHRRAFQEACEPCRRANAEYTRRLRLQPKESERNRRDHARRRWATNRLIACHRDEYELLLDLAPRELEEGVSAC
jgi:hypothetical protein